MTDLASLLGDEAESLLSHESKGIPAADLHLPGPDYIDRVLRQSDRTPQVLRSLQSLFDHGRLGGTGYVSILPVDQGIEHSGAASFAPNPKYFDPGNIVELAVEGGCNAVATTFGVLGRGVPAVRPQDPLHRQAQPRRDAHVPEPGRPGHVRRRCSRPTTSAPPASGRRSTTAPKSRTRQIQEVSEAFQEAHEMGLFTVLWAYLRNSAFKVDGVDYHLSADLTGQANHMAVTIEADIIKQKQPENNGGYNALSGYGKTHKAVYEDLTTDHPIDLTRWQVANCYMGRIGLINSGGASSRRRRPGPGRAHRGDQQAGRRPRPDLRPQGVPAPHRRRRRAPQRHPGRLPGRVRHRRLIPSRKGT